MKITVKDIINFVEGNINYLRREATFFKLPVHIQEQAIYRSYLCLDCLNAGACKICHCATPSMFYSPKKVDPDNKWTIMLEAKAWEEFKAINNINIKEIEKIVGDLATKEIHSEYNEETLPDTYLPKVAKDLNDMLEKAKKDETKG